ncbi:hypothetical protein DealDRAFT_1195 [Dethiobacter alkaliphilus AHT 1]|uniref:Uncharacterized protein n=1 Tax=Dethiobacter alkaliphilus AHT 1 TaxID=555088 RepID=C0GFD6_DETAL|nr:hypothetical protein DealDRAFT_1195 [Dethiobacter alkaliphilus AHT 1]
MKHYFGETECRGTYKGGVIHTKEGKKIDEKGEGNNRAK